MRATDERGQEDAVRAGALARYRVDDPAALARCLRATVRSTEASSGGDLLVRLAVTGRAVPLGPRQHDAVIAAATAALAVAASSGRASLACVALCYEAGGLVLAVRDDGVDLVHRRLFGAVSTSIAGAKALVREAGGDLRLGRALPRGAIVRVTLPV